VLDLYDAFATVHRMLTEYLPDARFRELGIDSTAVSEKRTWITPLNDSRIQQLAEVVEALHNALTHRLSKAYPESQVKDMAIDFRGRLNQVLVASDAPLMCGLGLLRKYIYGFGRHAITRDVVGAITKIGFTPGASVRPLRFGIEEVARVAIVQA